MNKILAGIALVLTVAVTVALPAAGQGLGSPAVNGNSIDIPLALPGGIAAHLTVTFETFTKVDLANLGVSARLVSPTDAGLLARLPGTVRLPDGFPVVVQIEPTATGGLAFTGIATVKLASPNLPATPDLRLYTATIGQAFHDATTFDHGQSYRVIGSTGGFSEFVAVIDQTPKDQAVAIKLDRLDRILVDTGNAIAESVRAELAAELAAVRADVQAGALAAAVQELDAFLATVERYSGSEIPDVWRAERDRVDVAGLLRAGGMTLRLSLQLAREVGS